MRTEGSRRYPGAQPFPDSDLGRKLFFGREQDSISVSNKILAHRLVVLFARSGLGKTSLLNAGVAEKLRAQKYIPLSVRVNDVSRGALESIYDGIADAASRSQGVEYVPGAKTSLWNFFKTSEFWENDVLLTPVLIIDQFEELFTLQSEQQRNAFSDQLSCVARGVAQTRSPSEATDDRYPPTDDSPPSVKIVLSLREDFLAELDGLSDRIPSILDERFRLLPLTREGAARALEEPARVEDVNLATRPFELDVGVREAILEFLERGATPSTRAPSSNIEPFQLQLICQRLEGVISRKQEEGAVDQTRVTLEEIGGASHLSDILRNFYKEQIAAVPWSQRGAVRSLCVENLISSQGRRLRVEESAIVRVLGISRDTLKSLVDHRLLRADKTAYGTYYELSHDSLIIPILNTARLGMLMEAISKFIVAIILACLCMALIIIGISIAASLIGNYFTGNVSSFFLRSHYVTFSDIIVVLSFAIAIYFGVKLTWYASRTAGRSFREFRDMWRRSQL